MAQTPADVRPTLRLWPGVAAAVLLLAMRFVIPIVVPDATVFGLIGHALAALAIVVWWLFFSRAPWPERVGAVVLMMMAVFATKRLAHESIAGGGMGRLIYFLAVPVQAVALVAWAVATRRLS